MRFPKKFDNHWYTIAVGFLFFAFVAATFAIILSYGKKDLGLFLASVSLLIAIGIFIVMVFFDKTASKKLQSIKDDTELLSDIDCTLKRIERLLGGRPKGPGKPPKDLYRWFQPDT